MNHDINDKYQCKLCSSQMNKPKVDLGLCFKCFLADVKKANDLIDKKINEINEKIAALEKLQDQITKAKKTENNILINYKYDVDLLNLEMAYKKYQIDLEINQKSKKMTNKHFDEIKQLNHWKEKN